MNLKKILNPILVLSILLAVSFVGSNSAYAGSSLSLSPASGTFTGPFSVDIVINTGGASINGVELELNYTGNVNYTSNTGGNAGCANTVTESPHGKVSVICFIPPGGGFNGTGNIVRLNFTPTNATPGPVTMSLANIDTGGTVDGATGGSYTVSLVSQPGNGGGCTTSCGGTLPHTGVFSSKVLSVFGLALIVLSVLAFWAFGKAKFNACRFFKKPHTASGLRTMVELDDDK